MVDFPKTKEFNISSSKKTTWLFGAGASSEAPYDVPMQGKLLKKFYERSMPGRKEAHKNLQELRANVEKHCFRVQPGLKTKDAILEEVFSAYELELKSLASSAENIEKAKKAITDLREAIVTAIQTNGPGSGKKYLPYAEGSVFSPYAKLLEKIFPQDCSDKRVQDHSLVTMNYDINLDRCLLSMYASNKGNIHLDYGVDFADFRLLGSFKRPGERSALLLRLHGGLNWIRCRVCQAIFTTIKSHATGLNNTKCKMCKCGNLEYIMVHPSYLREYDDPILQIVWGRLREKLINSDHWVFIGYSLPMADVYLREILRASLRIREDLNKKTKIVWVGLKTDEDDTDWFKQGENYYSIFGNNVSAWDQVGGFGEFVRAIK